MSEFFFDTETSSGRLYKIVDKFNNFLYWSFEVKSKSELDFLSCFSDFKDGSFLGLSDTDKNRALTRKHKT